MSDDISVLLRNTLESISVAGKDNMLKMLGCMNALDGCIGSASEPKEEETNGNTND
ncbi:MAG: hypothetical protein RR365_10425 [Bacteroides sp.]